MKIYYLFDDYLLILYYFICSFLPSNSMCLRNHIFQYYLRFMLLLECGVFVGVGEGCLGASFVRVDIGLMADFLGLFRVLFIFVLIGYFSYYNRWLN